MNLDATLQAGLLGMPPDELAGLVAQLEGLTAANLLRIGAETRWHKLRAGAEAAMRIRGWDPATQWRAAVEEARRLPNETVVLAQRIAAHARGLAHLPASELASRAWQAMVRRAGAGGGTSPSAAGSAGRRIVEFVAEGYGIRPQGMSDETLLEQTMGRVIDELLRQTQQVAGRLTPEEEQAVLAELSRSLGAMSDEQRHQVAQALGLERVSGEALWRLFRTGALGAGIIVGLQATGMGVFVAATTVVHAIFTTLLGVTLPFSVYTALTTSLGWLLGPVGWMLVGGVAWLQVRRQEARLARTVLGLSLVQIGMHALHRGVEPLGRA